MRPASTIDARREPRAVNRPRRFLVLWTAVILAAVVPWTDLQNHSHWSRVQWIPFVTPPVRVVDVALNVALYVPFGYLFQLARRVRRPSWRILACAAALSVVSEWTQLYSHSRFPSATDLMCNLGGACLGMWLAIGRSGRAS